MGTVGEITVLVNFSSMTEKLLGLLIENFEGVEENKIISNKEKSLDKLCATRWTVRARCFRKFITHYSSIQQLWEKCLV